MTDYSNMSKKEFCYWLTGYFELSGSTELTSAQVRMIINHLNLVFNKVTPKLEEIKPTNLDTKVMTVSGILDMSKFNQNICSTSPLSDPNERRYC